MFDLKVNWSKQSLLGGNHTLQDAPLPNNNMRGVYFIWHGGVNSKPVKIGQGNIAERITAHRLDPAITKYAHLGLYVTWAAVPEAYINGVERYLGNIYRPLVADRFPDVYAISVNLPD